MLFAAPPSVSTGFLPYGPPRLGMNDCPYSLHCGITILESMIPPKQVQLCDGGNYPAATHDRQESFV